MKEGLSGHSLIERIKHHGKEPRESRFGPLRLDVHNELGQGRYRKYRVNVDKTETSVDLTRKEAEMLWLLICVEGGVISTSDLQEWFARDLRDNEEVATSGNTESVLIGGINAKLKSITDRVSIKSERPGRGSQGYYLHVE